MKRVIAIIVMMALLLTGIAVADTLEDYEKNLTGTWEYWDFNHWKLENVAPNLDSITVWFSTLKYPDSGIKLYQDELGRVFLFTTNGNYKGGCLAELVFSKDRKSFLLIEGEFAVLYQKK